jgi:hypothetical protein
VKLVQLSSPAEVQAFVAHVSKAMDQGRAISGVTYTMPAGTTVTVRGVGPVVDDVIRAFRRA